MNLSESIELTAERIQSRPAHLGPTEVYYQPVSGVLRFAFEIKPINRHPENLVGVYSPIGFDRIRFGEDVREHLKCSV